MCVHTAHTLHLGFKVCAIRKRGVWRSHARSWWGCRLRLAKELKSKLSQKVYTTYPIFDLTANTKWVAVFKRFGFRTFYTGTRAAGGIPAIAGTSFSKNHHHLHIENHNGKI